MLQVYFYTKENCLLCEEVYPLLSLMQDSYDFEIVERDIHTNDAWLMEYQLMIPVVEINDTILHTEQIDLNTLEAALKEAQNPSL